MSKNKIQEERTRSYFVEAAKEILKSEGIQAVSARNVAEQAGYSYATLYNYFKDMKDLISVCLEEFQAECLSFVLSDAVYPENADIRKRIRIRMNSLVKYFIQYPGIYDLLYLEKTREIRVLRDKANPILNLFDALLAPDWESWCSWQNISFEAGQVRKDHILFAVSGMLLMFMNRFYPSDYGSFMEKMDQQIDILLTVD